MRGQIGTVGVVGLGTMGAGIVEVMARSGLNVVAVDVDDAAVERGRSSVRRSTDRAVRGGRLSESDADALHGRVRYAVKLADLSGADLVVEVVPERVEVKAEIFARLDAVVSVEAILATNTSSLSVTQIAAATVHPERVVGMHFFNPAPVQRLVEVVRTVLAEDEVVSAVSDLARRLGKTPVIIGDRAGFVANALLFGYLNHAMRMLDRGRASASDIDTAMSEGAGLPMGPFAVLDLIGLDTAEQILRTMYAQSGDRLHLPTPALLHLVTAGWLGRKSGRGFYAYGEQNGELEMDEPPVRPVPVVLAGPALGGSRLVRVLESVGAPVRRAEDAGADHRAVVVVELAGSAGHPGLAGGAEVGLHVPACAPWTGGESTLVEVIPLIGAASGQAVPDVVSALRAAGLTPVVCAAMAGYLLDALTAAQVNDAVRMQESGYASGGDIDAAMRLGCAYPIGPLALLARVGADVVLDVQRALHQESGEPGDLPSPRLVALAERAKAVVQEWNRPANGCG